MNALQITDQGEQERVMHVEQVLNAYFDALYACDSAAMANIFHAQAVYATADENPPLIRDLPTYLRVIDARESPASRNESRRDIIDSIEFAGLNTARAQVRCTIASRDFVDYLTLIREDGRWQIIAKVFQFTDKEKHRALR